MLEPLLFPVTAPCAVSFNETPNMRVRASALEGGEINAVQAFTDYHKISVELAAAGEDAARIEAWGYQAFGEYRHISIWRLLRPRPRGTVSILVPMFVWTSHQPGSKQIAVKSSAANLGKTLLRGDTVGIAGRWYSLQKDVTLDADGGGFLTLSQPISRRIEMGDPVTLDKPAATFAFDDDVWAPVWSRRDGGVATMRVSFSATEQ